MSDVWNEGYFTDVGYTYGYYREVSPAFQRFCLLIKGFDIPEPSRGTHCELGFGQGVSFNIHAASNPGHFVGTDFNPSHAAHASALSGKAGTDALILDDSFEQMLQRKDMPQFDSISLHGIWTWVSRENHKAITEFARASLRCWLPDSLPLASVWPVMAIIAVGQSATIWISSSSTEYVFELSWSLS